MAVQYVTKPKTVYALQFTLDPQRVKEICEFVKNFDNVSFFYPDTRKPYIFIQTPHHILYAEEGDYIAKHENGEFFTMRKETFEDRYQAKE